jgi:hypothetical protein
VTPQVLVEIDFPNATPGGRLRRHPKYKGIYDDLMAGGKGKRRRSR